MAKHYYQPLYGDVTMNSAAVPEDVQQAGIESVDSDFIGSKSLKRLRITGVAGVTLDSGTPDVADMAGGFYGFLKWPKDSAAPTPSTIDYQNSPRIFGRRGIAVSGQQP